MKTIIAFLALLALPCFSFAAESSPWSPALKSRMRLLQGGRSGPDHWLAGVEVHLEPNTLTYWRNPGEAGLPPKFDFSGSDNLKSLQILFPVPQSLSEGGVLAYGYRDAVIFPLDIVPLDPARPVTLNLKLDYATCEKICIPAHGEASLRLELAAASALPASLAQALAQVPQARPLGANEAPAIVAVTPVAGQKNKLDVSLHASSAAQLFVESEQGLYVSANASAPLHWLLTLEDVPPDLKQASLRLTLSDGTSAIETLVDVPLEP